MCQVMGLAQWQKWKSRVLSMVPSPDAGEAGGPGAHLSTSVGCWSGLPHFGSVLKGPGGDSGAVGQEAGLSEG